MPGQVASGAERVFNTPNLLSMARALGGPVVLVLVAQAGTSWLIAALLVMLACEATDALDGRIARRTGQVTRIGMLIDPMADSLYRMLVFLAFVGAGWMPVWMMAVIVARDVIIAYQRTFAQQQGLTIAARTSGKVKAVAQGAAQILTVGLFALGAQLGIADPATPAFLALLAATAVTAWSAVDYSIGFAGALRLR